MATDSLRPLKADRFDYWKAWHLLNRAGFGGTPSQVRALANMGLNDAVDYIVDYETIDAERVEADDFDAGIMRPYTRQERAEMRRARRSGDELAVERARRERQRRQAADRRQMADIQKWWLARLIETPRPLQEKMVLFWHGHFATSYRSIEDSYHMFLQNQMFRAHATGSFADLVYGIIRDPAMIRFLNNDQNRKQRPNENLARELMELFVLGEGNDYTERDIKEGARALTGYTFYDDQFIGKDSPRYQRLHDQGEKTILGRTGAWDGDDFATIILRRQVASEFLTWKLYRFFVNDLPGTPPKPTQGFILKLAGLLRNRDYELKPVLRTLLRSEHFYDAENTTSVIKSPIQLIVGAVRTLRTPVRELSALVSAADLMGQNIFFPPSVKGWPGGRTWINTSTMFVRQNLLIYLLTGRRPDSYAWQADGASYDATHLVEHLGSPRGAIDASDAIEHLLRFSLGAEPSPAARATLEQFVESHGSRVGNEMLIALLALISAMPEYQLC